MQEINTFLNHKSNVLLIAPTGWGKTTLLLDLVSKSNRRWVYLAPLRALANEFYIRCSKKIKGTVLIKHFHEIDELIKNGIDYKLLIITPELLTTETYKQFETNTNVVFDEIHLFYYWGDSFREKLIECYEEVFSMNIPTLSLTATMSDSLLERWKMDSKRSHDNSFIIDLNNHSLKKDPSKIIYIPKAFKSDIYKELINKSVKHSKLIFCGYRKEVEILKKSLQNFGFSVVSCIGGETELFQMELAKYTRPDFIIATTAISHGINLPRISIILFRYPVHNYDFWVQMVGRAGRREEEFKVYSMDKYRLTKKDQFRSILYLLFIKLKNKMIPYELRRYYYSQNAIQR
jgi:superfamily II DNA helicase RecQ